MTRPRSLLFVYCLTCSAIVIALFISGCNFQEPSTPTATDTGEMKTFTGKWSATGNRQTMPLGANNEATIFRLTGSLLLTGKYRLKKGFKADLLGFADTKKGLQGRSVWTDEHGDRVFSEVHAESGGTERLIEGIFLGGTGRYASVSGGYTFKWKRLVNNENGEISGRTVDLKGWARLGGTKITPTSIGDQQ